MGSGSDWQQASPAGGTLAPPARLSNGLSSSSPAEGSCGTPGLALDWALLFVAGRRVSQYPGPALDWALLFVAGRRVTRYPGPALGGALLFVAV